MHRFFITELDHVDESQALLCSQDLIHQFIKVLRFQKGETVVLLDNSGYEFEVELQEFSSKRILGKVNTKKFCETELPVRLVLAQAILKNIDKLELILQKGTELGVSAFIPLITDRTERQALGKIERLHRILREAAEQSHRGKLPELMEPIKFDKMIGSAGESCLIVPHPTAKMKFSPWSKTMKKLPMEVIVCIGPEGGFTDRETDLSIEGGANLIALGARILRAETAAITLGVLVNQWLGEM